MAPMEPMKMEPMKFEPMKLAAATTEFVPKGMMVSTKEQFPDLADAFGDEEPKKAKKGGKGKKKGKVVVAKAEEPEEEADNSVPWKGKSAEFFVMKNSETPLNDAGNPMNFEMNDEQWKFIYKHYPEYGMAPYDMMTWLYGQAKI